MKFFRKDEKLDKNYLIEKMKGNAIYAQYTPDHIDPKRYILRLFCLTLQLTWSRNYLKNWQKIKFFYLWRKMAKWRNFGEMAKNGEMAKWRNGEKIDYWLKCHF